MAFVYLLRCGDGSLYIGSCTDIGARLTKHRDGSASNYTRSRRPVVLVYVEQFPSLERALARERQIKRWTRAKKDALVAGDLIHLKRL